MMPTKPIIALIDLDCFYAQVEHNRLNISRDVPLAVQQWQGLIAVNYAARGQGLRSRHFGQELEDIRRKCPDLVLVHTDTIDGNGITKLYEPNQVPSSDMQNCKISLQRFRTASAQIQSLIASYSPLLTIEKASIDEVFIDLTRLVDERLKYNLKPDRFAGIIYEAGQDRIEPEDDNEIRLMVASHIVHCIRQNVYRQLNYTCSAGVANGKAFAKLVAGMHKPFQQTILLPRYTPAFLSNVQLTSIRGLGGKFGRILTDKLGVVHPSDIISRYTLDSLKTIFQPDKAEWLWQLCNGLDQEPVVEKGPAKSFQASRFFPKPLDMHDAENACKTLGIEIALRIAEDQEMYDRVPRYLSLHTINENRTFQLTGYTAEHVISAAVSMLHSLPTPFTPTKALSLRAYNFTNPELTNHKIEQFFQRTADTPTNKSFLEI